MAVLLLLVSIVWKLKCVWFLPLMGVIAEIRLCWALCSSVSYKAMNLALQRLNINIKAFGFILHLGGHKSMNSTLCLSVSTFCLCLRTFCQHLCLSISTSVYLSSPSVCLSVPSVCLWAPSVCLSGPSVCLSAPEQHRLMMAHSWMWTIWQVIWHHIKKTWPQNLSDTPDQGKSIHSLIHTL